MKKGETDHGNQEKDHGDTDQPCADDRDDACSGHEHESVCGR